MATFQIDYDDEFDDLFIYKQDKKSDISVSIADFVVDVQENGTPTGIEVMKASDTLSQLLSKKVTKEELQKITDGRFNVITRENAMYVSIIVNTKVNGASKQLTVPLVVPAIHD